MEKRVSFLKTTLIGGLVFLIPFVIIVAVLGKAIKIMMLVAQPFAKMLPFEAISGIAIINLLALLIMIFLCFFAGLAARSAPGRSAFSWLDSKLMAVIPGYAFAKSFTGSLEKGEEKKVLVPVLARLDDQAQVGFEVERLENGLVSVFLPGSSDIWSGTVAYFTEDRVEILNIDFATVTKTLRTLGRGSQQLFKAANYSAK
jgi:uncharacterized membrane protein